MIRGKELQRPQCMVYNLRDRGEWDKLREIARMSRNQSELGAIFTGDTWGMPPDIIAIAKMRFPEVADRQRLVWLATYHGEPDGQPAKSAEG
jgi:hypothetical protein